MSIMGVQKSRKSVKYTKCSLGNIKTKKRKFNSAELLFVYNLYKLKKNSIFSVVNRENVKNVFF